MIKKSLKERLQKLAGIKTLIQEQVIEGQWVNYGGQFSNYNPDIPGGQGINTACVYGCMDPDANNYDSNATCWGDQNGVMSVQSSMSDTPYNGIAYGPAYCTYGYSCDTFDIWLNHLYELGLANMEPPFNINPVGWPDSPEGMAEFICGGEPGSPQACAQNGGVCFSDLQYNPGQYCPACFTQYNWGTDGTGTAGGVGMCDCCCPDNNPNPGCTDQNATNYDPYATTDDGSCVYEDLGCTDENAFNYDPNADIDDGSCIYPIEVCGDPLAENFYCDQVGSWPASYNDPQESTMWSTAQCEAYTTPESNLQDLPNYVSEVTWYDENTYIQYIIPSSYIINNELCNYEDGCTDPEADNYNPDAYNDDGSCEYTVTCYICEDPPGPSMYGTPGEVTSEDFTINYNPEPGDEYCPEGYEENSENLDCDGTHITGDPLQLERITCYQCEYPSPPLIGQEGYVISQEFEVPEGQGCPEDEGWYNEEPDCSGDPFDPETDKRYRCKIIKMYLDGSSEGECVESSNGPFESLQECEDAGCGEKVPKKKRCYKCKGLGPVGFMFNNPPGCPKGWEDEPPTDCGCKDPLIDQWLVHPQIIGIHCCDVYLNNPGFEDSFNPGPECYNVWEELGGDPNFDPHQCCSGGSQGMPSLNESTLKERLKKLAGIKIKK